MKQIPYAKISKLKYFLENRRNATNLRSQLFEEYGDIYQYKINNYLTSYVRHPIFVQHILEKNQENYFLRHKAVFDALASNIGANGLFNSRNEAIWKEERKIVDIVFEPGIYYDSYAEVIVEKTNRLIKQWTDKYKEGDIIDINLEISGLILSIVLETLYYDVDIDPYETAVTMNKLVKLYVSKYTSLNKLPWILPTKQKREFDYMSVFLKNVSGEVIKARVQSGKQYDDLIGILIRAHQHLPESVAFERVREQISTFVIVSFLSTSALIQYTLIMLSLHPEIEDNVLQEFNAITAGNDPTYADVEKFIYFRAVLKETLRYWPVLSSESRELVEDDEIDGYPLKKGTGIIISTYHLHHHTDFWLNPECFNPTRFLENPNGQSVRHAYVPFGGGMRSCIGRRFAMLEALIIIPMILQHFRLNLPAYKNLQLYPTPTTLVNTKPSIYQMQLHHKST